MKHTTLPPPLRKASAPGVGRDSNIELLRLVAMMMVTAGHIIIHGFFSTDSLLCGAGELTWLTAWGSVAHSLCYMGVNLFLLITGWYGLRFRTRRLAALWLTMAYYAAIHQAYAVATGAVPPGLGAAKDVVLVVSQFANAHWWFMRCYVLFMLLAPMIRLDHLTLNGLGRVTLLAAVANLYFGYYHNAYSDGYCVGHFVFMYVVGAFLRRLMSEMHVSTRTLLLLFAATWLPYAALCLADHLTALPHWNAMAYNNPLLVAASAAAFLLFTRLTFRSRLVNRLAASALAIYLLQDLRLFRQGCDALGSTALFHGSATAMLATVAALTLAFAALAITADQLRLRIAAVFLRLYDRLATAGSINDKR